MQRVRILVGWYAGQEAEVIEIFNVFPGEGCMYRVKFKDGSQSVYYHNEVEPVKKEQETNA